ncbi:MAG: SufB/SufD family protein [Candidatus Zixiibacteriota bacterium]
MKDLRKLSDQQKMTALYNETDTDASILHDPDAAHIVVNHNKVLGLTAVPGLNVDVEEVEDGINAKISVDEGVKIQKKVHICFGMLPKSGIQKINLDVNINDGASIGILAHCVFANSEDVEHIMDAKIKLGKNANYSYLEKHVHGKHGGVKVIAKAKIDIGENSSFKTEFDLIKGRVGLIDMEYEATAAKNGLIDMLAKISGKGDDVIKINEIGHLAGERSRGVLTSKIAVRDNARAEIKNTMTATGAYSRGHVDCKEIVKDNATAMAIPIVDVQNPKAHITHEAAIGSVDNKQLETLMSRGLDEDEASELIIEGLLS